MWTPPDNGEGDYGVAVVLEDYFPENPGNFMSRVPLQFLIKVIKTELPCEEKPVFVDMPLRPYCFAVPVGDTFTLPVTFKHTMLNHRHGALLHTVVSGTS